MLNYEPHGCKFNIASTILIVNEHKVVLCATLSTEIICKCKIYCKSRDTYLYEKMVIYKCYQRD